jgi:hypothetical protein
VLAARALEEVLAAGFEAPACGNLRISQTETATPR